jgi:hypothetical protein
MAIPGQLVRKMQTTRGHFLSTSTNQLGHPHPRSNDSLGPAHDWILIWSFNTIRPVHCASNYQ